jgi:hypothetical protein
VDVLFSLDAAWSDAINGQPGKVIAPSIAITDRDTAVLTDGKMRLVDEITAGLQNGSIFPFTTQ